MILASRLFLHSKFECVKSFRKSDGSRNEKFLFVSQKVVFHAETCHTDLLKLTAAHEQLVTPWFGKLQLDSFTTLLPIIHLRDPAGLPLSYSRGTFSVLCCTETSGEDYLSSCSDRALAMRNELRELEPTSHIWIWQATSHWSTIEKLPHAVWKDDINHKV